MDHKKSFHQIIQWIEARLGLKPHSISLLIWKDRIKERMAACQLLTYEEYEETLQTSPQEMDELIELMINPETWFFRERGAFDYLTHFVTHVGSSISCLKILSLACSTGEEPYSIAMTLFDAGFSKDDFRIDALDIGQKALAKAQMGIYREKSFRSKDLDFRERYFHLTNLGYAINNQIKNQVFFYKANLLEEKNLFDSHAYQFIFCRNLLIYLHSDAQIEVLNRIKMLLDPQGILILGSAEAKIARKVNFEPILFPGANAFKLNPIENGKTKKTSRPQKQIFERQGVREKKLSFASTSNPILTLSSDSSVRNKEADKQFLLNEAIQKADEGAFEEAAQLCFDYISQYGAHAEIYYLLGLIHHAKGNEEEAKICFHKAVYLKPSYYEALICLALLYENQGEWNKAELLRKRALKYL